MMGMSYRVSYYTMASLGSGLAQLAFMAHWAFTLLDCNEESFEDSLQVLRFDYEGTLPGRKTRLVSNLWEVLQAYSRNLTHQTDGRTRYLNCGGLGRVSKSTAL